jgi:sugar lactone lactonase YvrE
MSYSSGATAGMVVAGGNNQGSANNQLNTPFGIYLDVPSNSLYIANKNDHNIVNWVVNASSWTLIAGNANGQSGPTSTTLNSPTDVTLDSMGNLYVTDNGNDRIQFFLAGEFTGTTIAGILGTYASATNALDAPQSVTLDSDLNLYVVDSGNNRIQKFQRY